MAAVDSEIERDSVAIFVQRFSSVLFTLTFAVMSIAWNEPDLTESSRPSWKTPAEGYGLSTVIHGALVALLSVFTYVETPLSGGRDLMMSWNSSSPQEAIEPDPVQPQDYQPRSGGSQSASVTFLTTSDEVKISAPDVTDSALLAATDNDVSSAHMADHVGTFSIYSLGEGDGTGDGEGDGFFGKPGSASSFVFVLDRSSSMNTPHIYSGNLSRFQRLKLELVRFIDRLKPNQKFFVIFFDEQPRPMPAGGLVEATDENKEQFLKWVTEVKANGGTDPSSSVKMAMYLNPDQIYFLSDGDILDVYRLKMMRLPTGEWILNTYSFGEGSERFMRVFAEKHEGKYTYIP